LTTGCIVYTNIQPVVKPIWQPAWQTAVSCIQPVVKPVVQPGLTTGWTNSSCSFNRLNEQRLFVQPVVKQGLRTVLNEQSVPSTWLSNRLYNGLSNGFDNRLYRLRGVLRRPWRSFVAVVNRKVSPCLMTVLMDKICWTTTSISTSHWHVTAKTVSD